MFKIKLALIVAVGLFVHSPRDWSHRNLPRPQHSERLSSADLFTLRVAVKLAGRKGLGTQASGQLFQNAGFFASSALSVSASWRSSHRPATILSIS